MEGEGECELDCDSERTEIDSEAVNNSSSSIHVGDDERTLQWSVVCICFVAWILGYSAGTLLSCSYFQRGGHILLLQWLLLCIGFPVPPFPILIDPQNRLSFAAAKFTLVCGFLGGMSIRISVLYPSGNALLCVTSLVFGAMFTFLLYHQGITPRSLNFIVFLLASAVVSGIWSSGERPGGVSRDRFILGSVFTILTCAINGLLLTLANLAFQNFSIIFVSPGHVISEGRRSVTQTLGYWITLACNLVAWHTFFLATIGLVYIASSLISSPISTVNVPLVQM